MKIEKAFCAQLNLIIDIEEATIAYFAQNEPERFTFYCSSPECQSLPDTPEIIGINYDKIPVEAREERQGSESSDETYENENERSPRVQKPHFKRKPNTKHSADCQWIINEEAGEAYIQAAGTPEETRRRRQRVAGEGLIEIATFITAGDLTNTLSATRPLANNDDGDNTQRRPVQRSHRIEQAIEQIARPKRSSVFSDLISDYMEVLKHRRFDEPLDVKSVGETTWGQFFVPVARYSPQNYKQHIFKGNVRLAGTYPFRFDWTTGIPNAVVLEFYDELTVGSTTAHPTVYFTRRQSEAIPGAFALMEAIRLSQVDDRFKRYLRCYFFGEIIEKDKNENNEENEPDWVLNVNVLRLNTIDFRLIEKDVETAD